MTLVEGFVRDQVYIDFDADVMFGDDQCYLDYPCRFPTVGFQLMATNGLVQIADRIRKDKGFKPMHALDEYTDDTCDNDGWYDFYVGLNGFADNHMDAQCREHLSKGCEELLEEARVRMEEDL